MGIEPLAWQAPAVMNRAGFSLQCCVASDDYPALTSGHQLALLKTECAKASKGTHLAFPPFAPVGMGTVLNQIQTMPLGDLWQPVHISRMSTEMNYYHCLCTFSNRPFHKVWINAVCVQRHIHRHRQRPCEQDRTSRGNKGEIRYKHLIPWTDPQSC